MSEDIAVSLSVTVFAQKTSMLAICTDVVLQKWVAEDIVKKCKVHLCTGTEALYRLYGP